MAVRTVSVNLEAKAAKYRAEVQASTKDTAKLATAADKTGKSIDHMAAEANQAGRKLDKMAAEAKGAGHEVNSFDRQLGQLDRQIDATALHLAALNREFAATGDVGLFKQIRSDRSALRMLQSIRKELVGVGDDSQTVAKKIKTNIDGGIGDALGSLPSELRGAAIVGGLAIATVLAPQIGAAIGGAVLGGVGAGGIVGGIVLASRDERVAAALERFNEEFMKNLMPAGDAFVGPLLGSFNTLRQAGLDVTNVLERGFKTIAPVVKPLADGLEGLAHNLGPGLEAAFTAAAPAIRAIAHELPEVGAAISDMLTSIADDSDGAIEGLIEFLHIVEDAIRFLGDLVGALSSTFDWFVRTGDAITGWGEKATTSLQSVAKWISPLAPALDAVNGYLGGLHDETQSLKDGLDRAKNSGDDYVGSLMKISTAEQDAAEKAILLKDAFDKLFGIQMSLDEANIRYQESIDKTIEALKKGKRTLDIDTQAGRDHKQAVLDQVKAIDDLRQANIDNGMSIDTANGKYREQLDSLRKTLLHLGYNKAAVDAMIGSYAKIPAKAQTTVEAPGLATVQGRLDKVNDQLNHMDGRVVHTTVLIDQQTHREDARQYRRWGGITTHAATGYLRDAAVYSSVASGARYAFAEPATGGEAFVPKNGPWGRGMSILSEAARWYGASVVPGRAMGGGGTPVIVTVYATAPNGSALTRELINTIQYTVRTVGGGDVNYLAGRR